MKATAFAPRESHRGPTTTPAVSQTMRLRRTGIAHGQRAALPTADPFDHMPIASHDLKHHGSVAFFREATWGSPFTSPEDVGASTSQRRADRRRCRALQRALRAAEVGHLVEARSTVNQTISRGSLSARAGGDPTTL
jgi:hypothetical protein